MRPAKPAWAAAPAGVALLALAGVVVLWVVDATLRPDPATGGAISVAVVAYAVLGWLVATRRPDHPGGWLLVAMGLALAVVLFTDAYSTHVEGLAQGALPLGALAVRVNVVVGFGLLFPAVCLFLMTLPDGRLPSRRWRPVAVAVVVVGAVGALGSAVDPSLAAQPPAAYSFGLLVLFLCCLASVAVRFRGSTGVHRQQLRWLGFVGGVAGVLLVGATVFGVLGVDSVGDPLGVLFLLTLIVGMPVAAGIAVLRDRLFDVDLVVSRTLVYASLAAFVAAAYVGIVAGLGSLLGRRDQPSLTLSIVATAVVAVAFQPVRRLTEGWVRRLVYGRRATPYEALSQFADRAAQTDGPDDAVSGMAQVVAEATGGSATVWLPVAGGLGPTATWPPDGAAPTPGTVPLAEPLDVPGASLAVPVRHRGDLLGAISVTKAHGDVVTRGDARLLGHLASQAGLLLRNVRLVDELTSSRRRLVAAQNDERRRLERDLHDGAQQRLVALALALRLAHDRAAQYGDDGLARQIAAANEELARGLGELRELARGLHPAVLTERGLGAAVRGLAERAPVPVDLVCVPGERFPPSVEATAYFVVSEALANVAKHAHASGASVSVLQVGERLVVDVDDDGVGGAAPDRGSGLHGLADRVATVAGTLQVASTPGGGTRVHAEIPCAS